MPTAKYAEYASLLETRIRRGDYAILDLPTENELAEETGSSRTTARRVLLSLVDKGLVARKRHGRLEINPEHLRQQPKLSLACLAPAFGSGGFGSWRLVVEKMAKKVGASICLADYVHWDDPVILQALATFDGVFVVPSSEAVPHHVLKRFSQSKRLVILDGDLTEWGVPSVHMLPPIFIDRLVDHLYKLGHRHIDCLNTQPHDRVVTKRIERWRFWQQMHQVEGRLIDNPVEPYVHPTPQAYSTMKRLLEAGEFGATALLCITAAAATGAMRALHEQGLQIGKDVSVCAVEGEFMAQYRIPSHTVLETPDPAPYVKVCMEWLAKETPWEGPLLIEPSSLSLFIGESTGPVPRISVAKPKMEPPQAKPADESFHSSV